MVAVLRQMEATDREIDRLVYTQALGHHLMRIMLPMFRTF